MTIAYLIAHRERPDLFTSRWLTVWVKRALLLAPLIRVLSRISILCFRGARVGDLTIVESSRFEGSLRMLTLGAGVAIGRNCHFALHDKVEIGERVVINNGVVILTASHDLGDPSWRRYSKPVKIDAYAWIATGATILPGVTIGRGAVVGAGAVVRRDVPPYCVVIGNPASVVQGSTRTEELDYLPSVLAAPFEAWLGNPGRGRA